MKVVAINGSPRKGGNCAQMLDVLGRVLENEGIEFEVCQPGAKVHPCMACYHCLDNGTPRCVQDDDGVNEIIEKCIEADGIVLASPVYHGGIAGGMKCVLDRLILAAGCGENKLHHKVGAALCTLRRSGGMETYQQLLGTINTMEMVLVTSDYWNAVHGAEKGEVMQDTEGVEVIEKLGLTKNSFVALAAGKYGAAVKTAGVLRKLLGAQVEGHMDAERYEFCWIVDFPMYEIGDESGELEFCHNPFSMPSGGLEVLLKAERGEIDPLSITADQYDLVCNGVELSSGAVRNHDPEIMIKAFELVRLGEEDVKAKFPAMYNAFCYGAPPHAGIAPGVDRMVMLLAGEDSIREIIPFPMNKNAQDIMMGAPSEVTQKQLDELHIAVTAHEEE